MKIPLISNDNPQGGRRTFHYKYKQEIPDHEPALQKILEGTLNTKNEHIGRVCRKNEMY